MATILLKGIRSPSFLSLFSGFLLALCFPKFSLGFLAWFAAAPLLAAISLARRRLEAGTCGLITGLVFFGISVHWLTYISTFGWLFVVFVETSFIVLFSLMVYEARSLGSSVLRILWTALAWLTSEVLRSEIPVFGFGWNLLAYSQADYSWVRQAANTIGAYGLSFVIAFVSGFLFEAARPLFLHLGGVKKTLSKRDRAPFALSGVLFALLLAHGFYDYELKVVSGEETARISLIQGNIPQEVKWEPVARNQILEIYSKLTELASYDNPDLIFWPEAAFPGYFNRDQAAEEVKDLVKKIGIPLVVGSPHLEKDETAYNSAYLLDREGNFRERYDKLILVPFGEYVPLKPLFGWLEPLAYSLGVSDFKEGKRPAVFKWHPSLPPFSVLICFENTSAHLARTFVKEGAGFLAVMTNDAWFGPSAAPYQHLQASIFRAIENGVALIHVANTGVSAFVSHQGVVLARLRDERGRDIFVTGAKTYPLPLQTQETLYRRGGYLFAYLALLAFVLLFTAEKMRCWVKK